MRLRFENENGWRIVQVRFRKGAEPAFLLFKFEFVVNGVEMETCGLRGCQILIKTKHLSHTRSHSGEYGREHCVFSDTKLLK